MVLKNIVFCCADIGERSDYSGAIEDIMGKVKVSVYSLALFMVITNTNNQRHSTAPQTMGFLLESGKAGPFELGATVEEIYSIIGRDRVRLVDLFNEGMFTPALEIQTPGSNVGPTIVAHIREWPCPQFSVWGILVRDRRFRTRESLGIGSTLGELRRHYRIEMMRGEGSEIAFAPALNLSFVLDVVDRPTDLSKVKSVWVPPHPQEVRKRRCPQLGPL